MPEIEWAEMEEDPQAVRHVILQALSRTSISGLVLVFMSVSPVGCGKRWEEE
jgi:hypothetical protein